MDAKPQTVEESGRLLHKHIAEQEQRPRDAYHLAIVPRDIEQMVGWVAMQRQRAESEWIVGFMVSPTFWGHGYATEACRAMTAFGLEQLGATRLIATVHPRNHASIRVVEKIGARRVEPRASDARESEERGEPLAYVLHVEEG